MKIFISLGALAAVVSAQAGTFEPSDFNITKALISNGVNVSAIPELAGLAERSALSSCSIAASAQLTTKPLIQQANTFLVLFSTAHLRQQQGLVRRIDHLRGFY